MVGNNGYSDVNIDEVKAALQKADTSSEAFKPQDQNSALNLLMKQDPEFRDNTLRLDVPNRRVALYIPFVRESCRANNYEGGLKILDEVCGLLAAVSGKRIDILSKTIIGERESWGDKKHMGQQIRDFIGNK